MSAATLTPPDLKRCQADRPNGANAFTIGGVPRLERCTEKPAVIVTEQHAGQDGQVGSMSLCQHCLRVLLKQHGPNFVVEAIKPTGAET